jgi:hypothetical protein
LVIQKDKEMTKLQIQSYIALCLLCFLSSLDGFLTLQALTSGNFEESNPFMFYLMDRFSISFMFYYKFGGLFLVGIILSVIIYKFPSNFVLVCILIGLIPYILLTYYWIYLIYSTNFFGV